MPSPLQGCQLSRRRGNYIIDLTFDFQHLSVTFSLRANRVRPLVPKERDYEERNTVVEALLEAHHSSLGDEELCTFVSQNILLGEPEKEKERSKGFDHVRAEDCMF